VPITREDIQNACAFLCIVDGIEGLGCENFISPQIVRDNVVANSEKLVEKIKEETKGKMIELKIDGLTHLNRSFIGVYA